MGLLKDWWDTILDSLTLRRVIAVPILVAVVTAVVHASTALSEFFTHQSTHTLLGTPSFAWGIFAGLLLILGFVIQHAALLRKSLDPKISVSFNPTGEGIVRTPTQIYEQTDNKWARVRTDQAVYIRITLRTLSQTTVKACVAYLTKIEKRPNPTSQFTDVYVPTPLLLTQTPVDVYPRVPAVVDLLKCGDFDNLLGFCVPTPFVLEKVFDDKATYRLTMEVNGDGITETKVVEVDWTGRWDAIIAR